jgi:hypothetical protein
MINTQEFVVMDRGNTNWLYNCETAEEVPRLKHDVPNFLPGTNPNLTYFADRLGCRSEPYAEEPRRRTRSTRRSCGS